MKFSIPYFWIPNGLISFLGFTFSFGVDNTPWWIEVYTTYPKCLYYFGPFDSVREAREHRAGFIEDLLSENAQGIQWEIKQAQPQVLTVFEEEETVKLLETADLISQ